MIDEILAQLYPDKTYITVPHAVKKYSLKTARIQSWIRRNQIDSVLLVGSRLIDEDQIPVLIEKGKKQ